MSRHDGLPDGIRRDADGAPVFAAPWHAQAFAMAVSLHETGVFDWPDWSRDLGAELASGEYADGEDGYYAAWLTVLERLLCRKGLLSGPELDARRQAWDRAARATAHGQPIVLES